MSETNYPKRGELSEDGKVYTAMDGTVHLFKARLHGEACGDRPCSLYMFDEDCPRNVNSNDPCCYSLSPGAYVPSAEEAEACDMARAMIDHCGFHRWLADKAGGVCCTKFIDRCCESRSYLAAHKQADAWEVKP